MKVHLKQIPAEGIHLEGKEEGDEGYHGVNSPHY